MPLRLDIKRNLTARSDRVKCVDLHPTEPWMLTSLYNGNVHVWNYDSQTLVKSIEACTTPVRCARFVPRKNWIVAGADDMKVRVFNYNTLERVHSFEAHSDYVRCIAVHPTQPCILSCSDDMLIKMWNWDKQWACQQVFEGHTHYVMQIVINPKDNNTFASASLDWTIKVWQLGSSTANFTLEGHTKGVNCVDYYHGGDKPYLISGSDDNSAKVWDYQNKTCVQTIVGHAQNVSAVSFHPELPIILSGSEDGSVRIWHSGTYRMEPSLNYGLERVWTIACLRGSNKVALGYDEGSIMLSVGREEPAVSMDVAGGKLIWARHCEIQQANLKALNDDTVVKDGEKLPLAIKDMGACEIYPQTIAHNPNGRFVVVCGDGEYVIYTAMALRNKSFGAADEFVWAQDSSEYAIREKSTVKVFKNFKERKTLKTAVGVEGIFGGWLLGIRSSLGLGFHDWETLELVRRIDIQPRHVYWSESGELVCLATDSTYFILKYNQAAVDAARDDKSLVTDDGIEDSFDVVGEVSESVKTGIWVGDCFIYTNAVNRINYYVGGEIVTISHLDRTMYLLGYVAKENRLYLGDKELNVVSYSLLLSVLEYQTAVMRQDFDTANRVLPTIPHEYRSRVALFLEKQGFKEQALVVSTDPDHRFDLALQLGDLRTAVALARESQAPQKWRQLADVATQMSEMELAQECLHNIQDYGGLLLLASASGNATIMQKLASSCIDDGKNNVGFLASLLLGDLERCLEILISTDRLPEAAFFARTYLPSQMGKVVELWKASLSKVNEKAGQSLASPEQYENLFPGYRDSLKAEQYLLKERKTLIPAVQAANPNFPQNQNRNSIEEALAAEAAGQFHYVPSLHLEEQEDAFHEAEGSPLRLDSLPSQPPLIPSLIQDAPPAKAPQPVLRPPQRLIEDDDDDDDDLELDIDNLQLDDNLDTGDITLDEDLLSED